MKPKFYIVAAAIAMAAALGFFLFFTNDVSVPASSDSLKKAKSAFSADAEGDKADNPSLSADNFKRLQNPPAIIRAIYYTGWSAGLASRIDNLIALAKRSEINAVVIDIKDYSGYVAYDADIPALDKYRAKEIKIKDIDATLAKLHEAGIYVIARITIFQDPVLAKARPDLAIHRKSKTSPGNLTAASLWLDRKGLAWMDPTAKEVWDYNILIAQDAANRGFDELNFDYIRFPSDGNLDDMHFPFYQDGSAKSAEIKKFFAYLREQLPGVKISADLFGLATVADDDMGIGQVIEDAYEYFDFVAPMVYPSHYANGTFGFKNPAQRPYEVIRRSMEKAVEKLWPRPVPQTNASSTTSTLQLAEKIRLQNELKKNYTAKLRPWLQDFDLGADYGVAEVRAQIRATKEALGEHYSGYYMWSPSNVYTTEALVNN